MRALIVFLIFLQPLLWVRPAQARSKSSSPPKIALEEPELAAKKACAEGDFKKGVSILADLYVRSNTATYIFNQGRCYEQNHQWVSAIDRFREYLRKARNPSSEERSETEEHIAECKRLLAEEEAQNAPAPIAPPPSLPLVPQRANTAEAPPQAPPDVTAPAAPVKSGRSLRTAGIIVGSVGVTSLGAAIALNLKANQLANAGDGAARDSYKTGALICYGAGGVAVASGLILYLLGRRGSQATSSNVALVPTWTQDGAGVTVRGGF